MMNFYLLILGGWRMGSSPGLCGLKRSGHREHRDGFLACSRACASKVFSLRADCGRVIVYPGLKQWERPRHNIFGVCTRLAGGVCMSTSANSSASKHLTVTKIVWKIVYVTFDYLISHFFKILSLEFMASLFRDFRASVSLKVFHYRLRGKWCQYDLEIN